MSNIANLSSLSLAALVALHNTAVDDYAPEGVTAVDRFKSKAKAIEAIEAMCAAGNLAVAFDGGEAIIIDATPTAPQGEGEGEGDTPTIGEGDDGEGEGEGDETPSDDGEGDDGEGDDDGVTVGDGKGAVAPSGFVYASDDWKRAMPRGTPEREAYRAARKRAARMARKAKEKAKAAAIEAMLANVGDDE